MWGIIRIILISTLITAMVVVGGLLITAMTPLGQTNMFERVAMLFEMIAPVFMIVPIELWRIVSVALAAKGSILVARYILKT